MERLPAGWRGRKPRPPEKPARAELERVPRLGAERKLLLLLLRDRSLVPSVAKQVEPDDFKVSDYREIFRSLLASIEANPPDQEGHDGRESLEWAEDLPAPLFVTVRELVADPEELTNPEAVLEDSVARIQAGRLQQRLDDLMNEVLVAETGKAIDLASEIKKVRTELAALGSQLPGRGLFRQE